MKLIKNASGKKTIKMSKAEWTAIGKQAKWLNKTAYDYPDDLLDSAGQRNFTLSRSPQNEFNHIIERLKEVEQSYLAGDYMKAANLLKSCASSLLV